MWIWARCARRHNDNLPLRRLYPNIRQHPILTDLRFHRSRHRQPVIQIQITVLPFDKEKSWSFLILTNTTSTNIKCKGRGESMVYLFFKYFGQQVGPSHPLIERHSNLYKRETTLDIRKFPKSQSFLFASFRTSMFLLNSCLIAIAMLNIIYWELANYSISTIDVKEMVLLFEL